MEVTGYTNRRRTFRYLHRRSSAPQIVYIVQIGEESGFDSECVHEIDSRNSLDLDNEPGSKSDFCLGSVLCIPRGDFLPHMRAHLRLPDS